MMCCCACIGLQVLCLSHFFSVQVSFSKFLLDFASFLYMPWPLASKVSSNLRLRDFVLSSMAQRNDGSESSSDGSDVGFGGIGINFGPDGISMVENLPGSQPSPQLMSLANLLLPGLMTRAQENMSKRAQENMSNASDGKGGKNAKGKGGYAIPSSGSSQSILVPGGPFGDAVYNEGGGASSSRKDPVAEDAEMDDEAEKKPKEGKGSKKKKSKKGKGKRAGKQRK